MELVTVRGHRGVSAYLAGTQIPHYDKKGSPAVRRDETKGKTTGSATLRRSAAVLSIAALAVGAAGAPAFAAGHKAPKATAQNPAVIYPLLEFFQFGDTIGAPLVCDTAASALGSGAAYLNAPTLANPVINAIDSGCAQIVKVGLTYIDMGIKESAAASAINPFVNPVIAGIGAAVSNFGNTYGASLNPLGPTIAGAGATIDFFEGS
jgi:hypothetical protein